MEYPATSRASQATPKPLSFPLPANAISEEGHPTTERANVIGFIPRRATEASGKKKPTRRTKERQAPNRKPPGAKRLDELKHVALSTNTGRYGIYAIDLQLFRPETKGRAEWVGRIKFEWKKGPLTDDTTGYAKVDRVRFADFTIQENFKRRMARQKTKSKHTNKTYNDDPWYQEMNAYLKFLNYHRSGDGLPEVLVSCVKWTEKYENSQKVKWEHREDQQVVVLLRNQDHSIHKVQFFDGRYILEFSNFHEMDDNLGTGQVHSCWYREDHR